MNHYLQEMIRNWLRRRREAEERAPARRTELLEEYVEKSRAGDPDAAEASRDFSDNDATPWSFEVGVSAIFLVLIVSVAALTALFMGIKQLTGG